MQPRIAKEGRSFDNKLNLCLKHRMVYILWFHFGWIFNAYPISRPFLMKIRVKYLKNDNHKITFHILTTTIEMSLLDPFLSKFLQFRLRAMKATLLVLFTLAKVSPVKAKSKAKNKIVFRPPTLVNLKKV